MQDELNAAIAEESPTATVLLSDEGRVLFSNPAAKELFGQFPDGSHFSLFVSEKEIPAFVLLSSAVKLLLDKNAAVEYLKKAGGESFFASVVRYPKAKGKTLLFIRDLDAQIAYVKKVGQQRRTEYELSRYAHIGSGDLEKALHEVAILSAESMGVSRINIWEIDRDFSSIKSIVNYDKRKGGLQENMILYRHLLPEYFSMMQTEEIIPTADALNDPKTSEIKENYLQPFGIYALMDVPIRIEGKMAGVVCFEDTEQVREWDVSEQNFATAIAQIIAQTIETNRRQKVQRDLEQALSEKKLLLAEINHRVKNNFSLIGDIIRLQEGKATDEFHKKLFADIRTRLLSMAMIHRQLYLAENIGAVNFRDFLLDLAAHFRSTFAADGVEIATLLDNCRLPLAKAVLCGLVVNELMTNACRHAFGKKASRSVTLKLNSINENISISVADNGTRVKDSEDGIGLELVYELANRLGAKLVQQTDPGTIVSLSFSNS